MGIVNVTPDSFSDGGRHADAGAAHRALRAAARRRRRHPRHRRRVEPARAPTPVDAEKSWRACCRCCARRVTLGVPGLGRHQQARGDARRARRSAPTSSTTSRALRAPGALEAVAAHPACGVCLMHMRGEPRSMQADADYDDVVARGRRASSRERVGARCRPRASRAERIVVDPGIGFGKTPEHNLELLRAPATSCSRSACPLLVGWSRKSTLGRARPARAGRHERAGGQRRRGAGRACSAARASCACTTSRRRSMR